MELNPEHYTIAWIAPLEIEARAAACMLDREHVGRFPMQRGDDYIYQAGEICGHNVVIATLPAGQEYGTGSAATLASQVKKFFPNFWFRLLVSVAAGLPRLTGSSPRDIQLGDILVALPEGDSAGLIAYDFSKETGSDGFQLLKGGHVLAVTEPIIRAAISIIKQRAPNDISLILPYYNTIKNKEHDGIGGTFADPRQEADRLYGDNKSGKSTIQERKLRPDDRRTRIWYGPIGSGDKLMKNVLKRNELRDRYNIIGLEMEAAGRINRLPIGVIRGVCDYADEHKNKAWQPYAAAMAAACAKALLAQIGTRGPRSVYYIPFGRNPNFTGRQTVLNILERVFFRESIDRVAVVGLGGMGKTQIALELAYRVRNMEVEGVKERLSVFWVHAQSIDTLHRTSEEVVQQLKIQCSNQDPKAVLRAYLESDAAGHWLLVVDDVDETIGNSGFFPQNSKGKLLITTRQRSVAVDAAGHNMVELSSMTFDEAYSLLEALLLDKGQVQDLESTRVLLETLMYSPLALAQAAAYINRTGTSFLRYLEMYRLADQNMIDKSADDESDIESVLSYASLPSSVSSLADLVSIAVAEWVGLLLNDEVLRRLYPIALSKVGPDRFSRNFARFLRNYSQNLSAEVSNEVQRQALHFARQSAERTAVQVTQALISEQDVSTPWSLAVDFVKSEQIDRWLATQQAMQRNDGTDRAEAYSEDADTGTSLGLFDIDEPQLQSLKEVKGFMVLLCAKVASAFATTGLFLRW